MYRTIDDVQKAVLSGVSVLEITQKYLQRIEEHKHLNAFLEVFTDSVLENASIVDQRIKNGSAGKLAGVVIGIKDNICYQNHQVSASSKILEGFTSLYTSTVLQRLLDEDAIVIGRLNCDEFAMGSSNENSAFGSVENNWKANHVPGGSSGGSAVAASANLCTITLGSDTGGSVRQPASWTGTYGLKPTYGRMSRYGLIAYASSFDQIGTFTNTAADAQLIYELSAGEDEMDATTSSHSVKSEKKDFPEKLKIGLISECIHHEGLDPEVKAHLNEIIEKQLASSLKSNQKQIGTVQKVLIEGTSKRSEEHLCGRTGRNSMVVFPKENYQKAQYVMVRIDECTSATLMGEVVSVC